MPPLPKTASTRARRNKSATAATLTADPNIEAPVLPGNFDEDGTPIDWHQATLAWWADIWSSPMAPEYDESDIHGLVMLAAIVDDFWQTRSAKARREAAAEIRLQSQRFGLSPIDRRRLQWEISRAEDAADKTTKRRRAADTAAQAAAPQPSFDPRAVLRAVQ